LNQDSETATTTANASASAKTYAKAEANTPGRKKIAGGDEDEDEDEKEVVLQPYRATKFNGYMRNDLQVRAFRDELEQRGVLDEAYQFANAFVLLWHNNVVECWDRWHSEMRTRALTCTGIQKAVRSTKRSVYNHQTNSKELVHRCDSEFVRLFEASFDSVGQGETVGASSSFYGLAVSYTRNTNNGATHHWTEKVTSLAATIHKLTTLTEVDGRLEERLKSAVGCWFGIGSKSRGKDDGLGRLLTSEERFEQPGPEPYAFMNSSLLARKFAVIEYVDFFGSKEFHWLLGHSLRFAWCVHVQNLAVRHYIANERIRIQKNEKEIEKIEQR